jgi:orotate phosphoribosyltransferase
VVEAMSGLLPSGDVVLAGLELGGIPLVTLLGQRAGRPIRFVRKAAKEYGTRQQIEGGPVEGSVVVLVEDVITTGGAVLAAVEAVRAAGGTVDTVVCLIDRQQGGRSALVAKGEAVRAVLTAADVIA